MQFYLFQIAPCVLLLSDLEFTVPFIRLSEVFCLIPFFPPLLISSTPLLYPCLVLVHPVYISICLVPVRLPRRLLLLDVNLLNLHPLLWTAKTRMSLQYQGKSDLCTYNKFISHDLGQPVVSELLQQKFWKLQVIRTRRHL